MVAAVLRRYLQPSPTLRWHPWAPLLALVLAFAFVFVVGVRWGYSVGKREVQMGANDYASLVSAENLWTQNRPAMDVMRKAGAIDAAVRRYLVESEAQPTVLQRIEQVLFYRGANPYLLSKQHVVYLAEFRLKEMGGSAPMWQVTASYCDEIHSPISGLDLRPGAEEVAKEYSKLLGRRVDAAELAPLVPNMRCEPRSVQ